MTSAKRRTLCTVPVVLVVFLYLCCSGTYASTASSLSPSTVVTDSVFTLKAITASNFTISDPKAGFEWGAGLSARVAWTQPAGSVPLNRIELLYGTYSTSTLVTSLWVGTTSSVTYTSPRTLSRTVTIESGMTYRTNYFLRLYFGSSMSVNSPIFSVVNAALAASIKIGANPTGSNNWAQGTYVRWTWTATGFPSSSSNTVRIELLAGSTSTVVYRTLTTTTSNDGTQSVYMPTTVPNGSYRLRIKSNLYSTVTDTSTVFKVGLDPEALQIAVTTTFPTNVTMGTGSSISWTRQGWASSATAGSVSIRMYKAGTTIPVYVVISSTSNDGYYSFTVPTTLDEGRYYIGIEHRTYSSVSSNSNEFNLVQGKTGYYVISSPTGRDVYQRGGRLAITYSKVGFPSSGYTRIDLKSNETNVRSYTITSSTTSTSTRYYTIPETIPTGGWMVSLTWRPSFSSTSTPQYTTNSEVFTIDLADHQKPPAITIRRPTETEASLITRTSSFTISWNTVGYKTVGRIKLEVVRVLDAQSVSSALVTTDDGSYTMRLSLLFASDAVTPNFDCRIKLTHTTTPFPFAYTERFNLRGEWDGKDLPIASGTPTASPGASAGVTTSSDGVVCTGCSDTVESKTTLTISWAQVVNLASRSVVLVLKRSGDLKYERFLKSITSSSTTTTTVTIPMAVSAKGYYVRVMDPSVKSRKGDSTFFTLRGDTPFIAIVEPASADTVVEDRLFRIGVRTRGITPGTQLLVTYSVSATGSTSAFTSGTGEMTVNNDGSAGTTIAIYDSPPGESKLSINVQGTSALSTPVTSSVSVRFAAANDPLVRPLSSGELRLPMPSAPFGYCVAVDQVDPVPPSGCTTWRPTNFCRTTTTTTTTSSTGSTLRHWAFPDDTDLTCEKWRSGLTEAQKAEICPNDPSALAPCATKAEWCGKYLPSCIRGYGCRTPLPCWSTCYPCQSRATCSALVRAGQLAKPYARHCYSLSSSLSGQTQSTRLLSMAYTGSASAFLEGEAEWIDTIAARLSISTDALTVVAFESATDTQRLLDTRSTIPPALNLLQAENSKVYVEIAYDESSGKTAQESTNAMVTLVKSEGSSFAVANVVDETSTQSWDSGTVSGGSTGTPNTGTPSSTFGPSATTPTPSSSGGVSNNSDDGGIPTLTIALAAAGVVTMVLVVAIVVTMRRRRLAAMQATQQQQQQHPHPHQHQHRGHMPGTVPQYQYQNPQQMGVAGYGFSGQQPGNHHIMIGGAPPLPDIAHAGGRKGRDKKKKKGGRGRSKSPYGGRGDIPMEPPSYADVMAATTDDGSMASSTAASTSDLSSSSTSATSTSS